MEHTSAAAICTELAILVFASLLVNWMTLLWNMWHSHRHSKHGPAHHRVPADRG